MIRYQNNLAESLLAPASSPWTLDSSTLGADGASESWSVRGYTLAGGLQEGVSVVEIDNGSLRFAVLPTRGMGIWKGACGPVHLGWDSPVERPVHPGFIQPLELGGLGWLKGFNEWIVRCGLQSTGAPGNDTITDNNGNPAEVFLPLHGNIANLPARDVELVVTDRSLVLRGRVDEAMVFGARLRLDAEIVTDFGSGALTIRDTVTNLGRKPVDHELLYHVNYGEPLLGNGSRLLVPSKEVAPRDPRAAEGIDSFDRYGAPRPGFVEQAYWFVPAGKRGSGETLAMLRDPSGTKAAVLRFSLKDFPCFTQWKNTAAREDGYVTGLEPSTSYPNPRRFERERGRVLRLEGGESRTTTLTHETLLDRESVRAAEDEIERIQNGVRRTIHPEPIAKLSELP